MDEISKVIVFQLNQEQFAVNIQQVRSIEKLTEMTDIPGTSRFIKGVINLRGDITPIIDLKDRLHIGATEHTDNTRVLIVSMNDMQVGLIVDSATDVIDMDESLIDPPPEFIGGVTESYLVGVAKLEEQLIILLDLQSILNLEEIDEVKEVVEN